jgi:hypothetical protein
MTVPAILFERGLYTSQINVYLIIHTLFFAASRW